LFRGPLEEVAAEAALEIHDVANLRLAVFLLGLKIKRRPTFLVATLKDRFRRPLHTLAKTTLWDSNREEFSKVVATG